jgi:two-component system response regulator DegU
MVDRGSPPLEALSPRESEVLDLVADGRSNKAIGLALRLSEGTVKAHVSHIMAKLRLANRSQLVAYAIATAMVSNGPGGNRL